MSAGLTDNFQLVAAEGSLTTLASPGKALGATTINIANAGGWPTATGFTFAIRQVTSAGVEVPGTYTEWIGTLSGTTIALGAAPSPVYGSDQVYVAGNTTQVFIPVSSYSHNLLITTLLQQHTQAGAHHAITTDTLGVTGASTLASLILNGSLTGTGLGSQVTSYTGTNVSSGYYLNLGGVKICWGVSAQQYNGNPGTDTGITFNVGLPASFFSTIQLPLVCSVGPYTNTWAQYANVEGWSTSVLSINVYETTGDLGYGSVSWIVIGT